MRNSLQLQLTALLRADYYGQVRYRPVISPTPDVRPKTLGVDAVIKLPRTPAHGRRRQRLQHVPGQEHRRTTSAWAVLFTTGNVTQFGLNGGFYYGKLN
jgi:hypothetical protein